MLMMRNEQKLIHYFHVVSLTIIKHNDGQVGRFCQYGLCETGRTCD